MRSFLTAAVGCLSLAGHAMAQGDQTPIGQCRALQSKTGDQVAFVIYTGATTPVSNNEFDPTRVLAPSVDFHICVPVSPQNHGALGAVNIKVQVYSSEPTPTSAEPRTKVEYENNTAWFRAALAKYRTKWGAAAYPTIDIADYQNYHGCSHPRPHPIGAEFHLQVGDRRTDDDPYRSKFVFRRDILPTCDMPELVTEFIRGLPSPGPTVAYALGRYDPKVEKIIGRRSVLLQYDFRTAPSTEVQYLTYDFNRVGKDKCVRIEASYVFDSQHFGSDIVGVACVSPTE